MKEIPISSPRADKVGLHILLKLAALVTILTGIHAAVGTLVQLLLTLLFAVALNPLVTWFIRRRVRRPFAITLAMTAMLVVLTALLGVLAVSPNNFVAMLLDFNRVLMCKVLRLQECPPFLNLRINLEYILRHMDSERLITWATMLMTRLSGAMASIVLLVTTAIFMLFGVHHLPCKLRSALNNPRLHITGLHRALKGVTHYLMLRTLISLWIGLIVQLELLTMRVQFALTWGVLVFLLNYVSNIGSIISATPPVLQVPLFSGIYECLLVGALSLVVHIVLGNMVEPRMMGHWLGVSTLAVFLSLLVWG